MNAALGAGLAYFAVAFGAGFALGVLRVLILAPLAGELAAVLAELPVMLALCWLASRWLLERMAVPARPAPRLAMGGLAFALLMLGELAISMAGLGRAPSEHLAAYRSLPAALGLAAQLAFALIPLAQLRRRRAPLERSTG